MEKKMNTFEALRPLLLLEHNKTQIGASVSEKQIADAEAILGKPLPPSFHEWLLTIGDEAKLFDGNLRFDPLFDQREQPCIVYNLQRLNQHNWKLDSALIVFGSNGEGELWAFDSAVSIADEYPIVQVGAIFSTEGRNYKLWNSSFVRFLYSQALWWTRYFHPDLPEPENEAAEEEWMIAINRLLDPTIELGRPEVYTEPQIMDEIRAHFR
jgi:SMI1 / KNR4 family (SUKH-1)